jgi:hypothetical protein
MSLEEKKAELRDATKRANILADIVGGVPEEEIRRFDNKLYEEYKDGTKESLKLELEKQQEKMFRLSSE